MSVLILSDIFPPQTGGSGRWLWEVYRRFPRGEAVVLAGERAGAEAFDAGHEVRVVRFAVAPREWGISSPGALRGYWRSFQMVRRLARQERIDELHCARCLPEGWIALMAKKVCGLPFVCYVHGEELSYGRASRELGWQMRRVFRAARLIVANSHNTARLLTDEWRLSPNRLRVLHPGVDAEKFCPAAPDEAVRRRFGWTGKRVVLTVGRLQRRKGHDMLIRALGRIRQRVPNVLYAIVGDGDERRGLEELARPEGVADAVQFLGELDDEMLVRCYQQCDLFVLPNREINGDIEGFGMVLVEAQACGKPVIAGASGGTAETMSIPETGMVLPCDEPEGLVEAVSAWLLDEELLARKGRAARQWVEARFDWGALHQQARSILDPCSQALVHAR